MGSPLCYSSTTNPRACTSKWTRKRSVTLHVHPRTRHAHTPHPFSSRSSAPTRHSIPPRGFAAVPTKPMVESAGGSLLIRACHVSCRRLHAVYHASVGRRHHGACVHAIQRTLAPSNAGFVPAHRGESVHHRAWRVLRRRGQGQDGRRTRQVPAGPPTRPHDVMPGRTLCASRAHAAGSMAWAVLHVVWRR